MVVVVWRYLWWWWGTGMEPQTGIGSPENNVETRFPADIYVDTVWLKGVKNTYINPNASWKIWWLLLQSTPA